MTAPWQILNADEDQVRLIGELIAIKLRPGDVVLLDGDLGAGKTTLARALVRGFSGDVDLDVPSPTFALIQTYQSSRFPLAHLDLYRLQDESEVQELGIGEVLSQGAVVVEWPDRMTDPLSENVLHIGLKDGDGVAERTIELTAAGSWSPRLERLRACREVLNTADAFAGARLTYLQGDASWRSYARINGAKTPALLMDSPPQPDGPPVRNGLPYSRLAGLAEDVRPFVAIANALQEAGLAAPDIYASDIESGVLILEDFGDGVFAHALQSGLEQKMLWRAAVDVLLHLRHDVADHTWSFSDGSTYRLPVFTKQVMDTECALLLDWYWPHAHGASAPSSVRSEFKAVTQPLFEATSRVNRNWVLRDFHSPNLIWRPEHAGLQRVGIIDFQDALRGPPEYDLVSLLQDARIDVPENLELDLLKYYLDGTAAQAREGDAAAFCRDEMMFRYRVLGAQRAMKILGIFARLAKRDGKPQYLANVPRVWRYLDRNIADPALRGLQLWFAQHFPADVRIAPVVS